MPSPERRQAARSSPQAARYSFAVKTSDVINVPGPLAANMSWDGWCRLVYDHFNKVIQRQANELLRRGNVTFEEMRKLVEVQRNGLVVEMRKPLTPFGKLYSEALKPATSLPTAERLLARKGSIEAVLVSVGKTRAVTNRVAFIGRSLGTLGFVLEIVIVAVVIEQAPPNQRDRVATEEISGAVGGLAGGTGGYLAGGLAGAAWAGTWAAPTLIIPVVGEFTEGGAILIGGIAGALFGGWVGHRTGKVAGREAWKLLPMKWTHRR